MNMTATNLVITVKQTVWLTFASCRPGPSAVEVAK